MRIINDLKLKDRCNGVDAEYDTRRRFYVTVCAVRYFLKKNFIIVLVIIENY